jgi:HEAT repeat protein
MAESQEKGEAFELRVKALLEQHGFRVERDALIAGNQIDLVARRSVGPVPEIFVVECKAHARPVGVNDVNVFIGEVAAVQREDPRVRGIFVSSKGFTKEAKRSAAAAGIICLTAAELEQGLPPELDFEAAIARYNQHVAERYGRLTLYSLKADVPLSVELERVYVQLTAVEQVRRPGPARERMARERMEEQPPEEETEKQGEKPAEREVTVERVLSAQEALAEAPRLVVVGAPGSGKTTLLQWIALTFARNLAGERLGLAEHCVPVFVPLRAFGKYVENHPDRFEPTPACLLDFLVEHFGGWQLDLPKDFFARLAEGGRCTFLFDGLDEVADPGRRADVVRAVEAFVARYGGNRYTVTSRPAGYTGLSHLGADFQRCNIRPFTDEDVESFVTNWYLAVETAAQDNAVTRQQAAYNAADLLRRIRESDRIRRLVDTPLLLTVVALVHQNRTTLPQRRAELYDECTQMLLGFWDEAKGGEAARELARLGELVRQDKRAILEPVALRLHERREAREVEGEELRSWLQEEFASLGDPRPDRYARLFLRVIQERAGLLIESEPDTYRFSHLTFQEYLAARAVADRDDYVEYTLARRHDPWWREVILLEVGHLSTPRSRRARRLTTDLVQAIWTAKEEDPLEQEMERLLRRNPLMAGHCLADLGPIGVKESVRDEIVSELGQILRITSYSRLREEAAQVLAGLGGSGSVTQAMAELAPALADADNWRVREVVASSLGRFGQASPNVIQALIAAFADAEPYVRQAAASGLVQLGQASPNVVQALVSALTDANSHVRQEAAFSLGQLSQASPNVIQALIAALGDAESWRVRQAAASSLVQLGQANPDVVHTLIAIPADTDPDVRQALTAALGDGRWRVRQAAASTLGQLGQTNPEVVKVLIDVLADADPEVRRAATSSLVQLGQTSPDVVEALIAALAGVESRRIRQEAASSLVQLGKARPDVVHALIAALADAENWRVRQEAAFILARLGQASLDVVAALTTALADAESWHVRQEAASTLIELDQASPDVVHTLIAALSDAESWPVRQAAAFSLGDLGTTSSNIIPALTAALADADPDVRRAAASSLGRLGRASPGIVQALIAALADADPYVRQAMTSTLVQLGQASPDVAAALVAALADVDPDVRGAAASSLVQLGQASPDVVAALTAALADANPDVRQAAASTLVQLGRASPEIVQTLFTALANTDSWRVRQAAASALVQLGQTGLDVVQALIAALADADPDVRGRAASSLIQLGQASPDTIQALITAPADADLSACQEAASTLGQVSLAGPEAVATLVAAFASDEWGVRQAAAFTLVQLGHASPAAVAALTTALANGQRDVRQAAASGLSQLSQVSPDVTRALVEALKDSDSDVRKTAANGLVRLAASDRKAVLHTLLPVFSDPTFERTDVLERPGHDYAFDALWAIAESRGTEDS